MRECRQNVESLYRVSIAEHEGIGTAYEYYAKSVQLKRFLDVVGRPKTILIAGLPERYGFSMDFFMLAQSAGAEVVAVDERGDRIREAQEILAALCAGNVLKVTQARFEMVADLCDLGSGKEFGGSFDLALSCEVVQRLGSSGDRYFSMLRERAKHFAVFVPNGGNNSHVRHSGLRSICLDELLGYCTPDRGVRRVYASGYLDMPPFPPGVTRSQEKRERAAVSRLERFFMKGLDACCRLEPFWPSFVKARFAHIAYVTAGI